MVRYICVLSVCKMVTALWIVILHRLMSAVIQPIAVPASDSRLGVCPVRKLFRFGFFAHHIPQLPHLFEVVLLSRFRLDIIEQDRDQLFEPRQEWDRKLAHLRVRLSARTGQEKVPPVA